MAGFPQAFVSAQTVVIEFIGNRLQLDNPAYFSPALGRAENAILAESVLKMIGLLQVYNQIKDFTPEWCGFSSRIHGILG